MNQEDVVQVYYETWNSIQPVTELQKLVSEDFHFEHGFSTRGKGWEAFSSFQSSWQHVLKPFYASFKIVGKGPRPNEITAGWTVRGIMANDFGPVKANNKWVTVKGFDSFQFNANGQLCKLTGVFDSDYLMKQFTGQAEEAQFGVK